MRLVCLIAFLACVPFALAQPLPPIPDLQPCGAQPQLSVSPIADSDLASIWPLGHLDPPIHIFPVSHLYLLKPSLAFPIPVSSPGPIVLQVVKVVDETVIATGEHYQEYSLVYGVCGGVKLTFGHITPVSARISDAISGLTPDYHTEADHGPFHEAEDVYFVSVRFHPYEQIGLASQRENGTDFGAFDLNAPPLPFIHPERYGAEARVNVCPVDLFIPPVHKFLESRLGTGGFGGFPFVPRTAPPICGTVNQDIAETLQGNWFYDINAPDPEDHHIALVHDKIDPSVPVFSIGDRVLRVEVPTPAPPAPPVTTPFPAGLYTFTPNSSGYVNRDFSETEVGKGYCYQDLHDQNGAAIPNTIIRVNLTGSETMQIEARHGSLITGCQPVPPGSTTGYLLTLFAGVEFKR